MSVVEDFPERGTPLAVAASRRQSGSLSGSLSGDSPRRCSRSSQRSSRSASVTPLEQFRRFKARSLSRSSFGSMTDAQESLDFSFTESEVNEDSSAEDQLRMAAEIGQMLMETNEQSQRTIEHLESERSALERESEALQASHRETKVELKTIQEQLEDLRDQNRRLLSNLRDAEAMSQQVSDQNLELQKENSDSSDLLKRYQSEFEAEREVLISQLAATTGPAYSDDYGRSDYGRSDSTASILSLTPLTAGRPRGLSTASTASTSSQVVAEIFDPESLIQKNKQLRARAISVQQLFDRQTDEYHDVQRKLTSTALRCERLERETVEYKTSAIARDRVDDDVKRLQKQLDAEREKQKDVIHHLEHENDEIYGRMESMTLSAMHYQKKWDEEKRLRSESRRELDQARSELNDSSSSVLFRGSLSSSSPTATLINSDTDRYSMGTSLLDEIKDAPKPPEVEQFGSIKDSRDCNREFFFLTCLSVKVSMAVRFQTDLCAIRSQDLLDLCREQRVPFHQYHKWVEKQVVEDYRTKAREIAAEKERRHMLLQRQQEQQRKDSQLWRDEQRKKKQPAKPNSSKIGFWESLKTLYS